MRRVVLDTELPLDLPCLGRGAYYTVWKEFFSEKYILCYTNEILSEYEEILSQKMVWGYRRQCYQGDNLPEKYGKA